MSAKKTIWILVAVGTALFVVIGLLVTATLLLWNRPPTSLDDAHLRMERAELPADENAFAILERAAARLDAPTDYDWRTVFADQDRLSDDPVFRELLERNAEVFQILETTFGMKLQVPEAGTPDEDFSYLTRFRDLALLLELKTRMHREEGNHEEAMRLAAGMAGLGHALQNAEGLIIHYLVGTAIKSMGKNAIRDVVAEEGMTAAMLERLDLLLADVAETGTALTNVCKVEYHAALAMTQESLGELGVISSPVFSQERTRQLFIGTANALLESIPKPHSEHAFRNAPQEPRSFGRMLLRRNVVGEVMHTMIRPSWESFLSRKSRENVDMAATRALIALRRFHLEHGGLPGSLDELVPDYLEVTPVDDFDGEPLRYSRERRLLWSVGSNLIDDGGDEFTTGRDGPQDVVFPIGF